MKETPRDTALVEKGPCGFDLSPNGQIELLRQVPDNSQIGTGIDLAGFSQLVLDILLEIGLTPSLVLDDFASSISDWFPVLDLGHLRGEAETPRQAYSRPSTSLLWLVIVLVTALPCGHAEHPPCRRLYKTLYSLSVALRLQSVSDVYILQAQALIALYECSQGMGRQAYMTLSSSVAMATIIDAGMQRADNSLHWKVALLILDRLLTTPPPPAVYFCRKRN